LLAAFLVGLVCPPLLAQTTIGEDAADQNIMTADAITNLLQQRPELLQLAKRQSAHQAGTDPSAISNDKIFDSIRNDSQLRAKITQALQRMGYDTSTNGAPARSSSQQSPASPTGVGAQPNTPQDVALENAVQKTDIAQERREETPAAESVQQRAVPYSNLPSLQDLYSQLLPPDTTKLRRFGSDVFRLGTGNSEELPMDLPAGPDYVLGPGDALVINIWGSQSQSLNQSIDRQGQVVLPEAGTVTIAGMTIDQAQGVIQRALRTQLTNVHVEISLGRVRSVRIYVVGDVQRPGAYDISSLSTPLNALYASGGPTSVGSLRTVFHYRGKTLVREIDLYDFLLRGVSSDVERLLPGDTILVPTSGAQVVVSGRVRRPAIYELKPNENLKEVLDFAGGVLVSGSLQQINVERVEAHQRRTMLSVRLASTASAVGASIGSTTGASSSDPSQTGEPQTAAASQNGTAWDAVEDPDAMRQLAAFHVMDDDNVVVLPIMPYNERAVYLDGHVFRPGKYPYRDGMKVNDLLRSYQDVMPEPADHAELIRLRVPDYQPETIPLSLPDVLSGNNLVSLQPFDVIRVFSRYEIDPPKVYVDGEVLRPGEYPLAQGMTAGMLVKMAGGFKRSAYRGAADLASYAVQNQEKVLVQESTVEIGKAMEGNESADVKLKPGDILSVRLITGWQDIGSSVKISGEVGYVGTYGVGKGERLSSLLQRAGGFLDTAYPAGAVFERVQVRESEEQSRLKLIQRIQSQDLNALTAGSGGVLSPQEQLQTFDSIRQQQQQAITALRNQPANGRLVINISKDIAKWENTSADLELRDGDSLYVPKRADFVIVAGQVNGPTALTYVPGKRAAWYLRNAGGTTKVGNRKDAFIVRANGSVLGNYGGMFSGSVLSTRLNPGDSVVIPEKVFGGSFFWKNLVSISQLASAAAITAAIAAH
jgi:protein involved in polysaccharide export with SLBB domain